MPTLQGLPDRCTLGPDGSYTMTLLPGDGKRIEFTFNQTDERLPAGVPFIWDIEAGVIESDTPAGHEWCLWQFHTPNEAGLETAADHDELAVGRVFVIEASVVV